jgi:twinkle protein
MEIYSGKRVGTGAKSRVEPHLNGDVIVFPFLERGEVVAEKYRGAGKVFSQRPNPKRTFYNSDVLDDPTLIEGRAALVIVEGEIDCLSVIETGNPFVVSVPDGAPPARDSHGNLVEVPAGTADIDPAKDAKFAFIANNWERLSRIKRITIATDNDEGGLRLAAELVRRLGRVRCSFVTWPEDCKDANEVLVRYGPARLSEIILNAKPYPVSGVYTFEDLPPEPELEVLSTGFGRLDPFLRVYRPALMTITGLANHGKSAWANQMVANLAILHRWPVAIASFEMRLSPFVTGILESTFYDHYPEALGDAQAARRWMQDHFVFLSPEPDCAAPHDIDWLIERAEAAVIRHGVKVLLIDPWNEIEHARRHGETLTEYTNRAIRVLKDFGRKFDLLIIVVAHPTKSAINKTPEELTLYDVSDSAAFQNKSDLGVVIARLGDVTIDRLTGVYVRKVRYQPDTGRIGSIELTFDSNTRLFSQ